MKYDFPWVIFEKYFIAKFDNRIRIKYELLKIKKIVINVNNFCNLNCFSCVSLCDKPFNNTWRDEKREIEPEIVDMALKKILKYGKYGAVTLAGGEPTAMNLGRLKEISEVIRANGLKVSLITNGFRLSNIDPFNFDYICIDDHGTNTDKIRENEIFLKSKGFNNYFVIKTLFHKDFEVARREPFTSLGVSCPGWLQPTIWLDVVYPCCGMPQLEGWDNDTILRDSLRREGWTVTNPNLSSVMKNWRKTIPPEVIKKCLFSCWKHREKYIERNILEAHEEKGLERLRSR